MTKLVGPALSLDASKSMKKTLTFQRTPTGNKVYKWTKPGGRSPFIISASQLAQRALYQAAVAAWNALSSTQKAAYNATAKAIGYIGTGYNYFLRQQILAPTGPPVYDEDDMLKLATVTGIDLKVKQSTLLYTVPAGKALITGIVVLRITVIDVNNLTINPFVTVENIVNSEEMTFLAEGEYFYFMPINAWTNPLISLTEGPVNVIVDTATDMDVCIIAVDLWGYLVDV